MTPALADSFDADAAREIAEFRTGLLAAREVDPIVADCADAVDRLRGAGGTPYGRAALRLRLALAERRKRAALAARVP